MRYVDGSNDRRSPSLSPRKGNNHPSSSAAAFRQSDRDLLRPESASLLPQGGSSSGSRALRPPTFDGVEVVAAERTEDATPSKRLRNDGNGGGGRGGEGNKPLFLPAWAGGALHLTTAVVGVGILGLPRALVDLGWPGGIAFMAVATAVSLYTALLLVELCSEGGGGGELGGGASSSAAGGEEACSRSPPPPPEPLLHPLPPPSSSSLSNGSSSGVVGRRGSNQDLQGLTESESSSRRSKRRGGAAASSTAAAAASGGPLPTLSSSGSRYDTYGAVARATLGPRAGGAVASMQLLACAGCVSFPFLFKRRKQRKKENSHSLFPAPFS